MIQTLTTPPQTRINIIGIGGLSGHGKTTLGHFLQQLAQEDGYFVQQLAFADPLKSIVRMVQQDYVNKNPDQLQATSDQWKMNYGTGCFAKDLTARIEAHSQTLQSEIENVLYIISDVRFITELNALQAYAAVGRKLNLIRVFRPDFTQDDRNLLHPSETELIEVQYENYRIVATDLTGLKADAAEVWNLIKTS
jgi:thymidylate kinase